MSTSSDIPEPSLESLFWECSALDSEEHRAKLLDEKCADRPALRDQVQELLAISLDAQRFAEDLFPMIDLSEKENGKGTMIGPYKLLQEIGRGGMGVVYMAEQSWPVKRRIALKIIKPGMDTDEIVARFEAERQTLAMMDHPNIAKVLDAGQTASGLPYFVMDLVKGLPITKFCDERKLTTQQRIELFMQVCRGIQHAHQKSVIHRDIKPSNVLVSLHDSLPVPKIIDFGVAKAMGEVLTGKTVFTRFGQVVGTFEYMSPEQLQFNQLDVDTRSDVYSLGILLYELLVGEPPFTAKRLRLAALEELIRIIGEEEPIRPSQRLSSAESRASVADNHQSELGRLISSIRGDLDWIVMKAVEKDRERRYVSANALADDLLNFLADKPVTASPPSALYRARKFARRNRMWVGFAGALVLVLIGGIAGTSWQAAIASGQRDRAVAAEELATQRLARERVQRELAEQAEKKAMQAAEHAEQQAQLSAEINRFIQEDILGMADAWSQSEKDFAPDPNGSLRSVLDRAASGIEQKFQDQPEVAAEYARVLGMSYFGVSLYKESEAYYRRSFDVRRNILGPDDPATLRSAAGLAKSLLYNDPPKSETLLRETIPRLSKVLGPQHLETLRAEELLATALAVQDRSAEAYRLREELLPRFREALGTENQESLHLAGELADSLVSVGRYAEAEALVRPAYKLQIDTFGAEHPRSLVMAFRLASVLREVGADYERCQVLREAAPLAEKTFGANHLATLQLLNSLGDALLTVRRFDEAEMVLRTLIERMDSSEASRNQGISQAQITLANVLSLRAHMGDPRAERDIDEAEMLMRNAYASSLERDGKEHPTTVLIGDILARTLMRKGAGYVEASQLFQSVLDSASRRLPANDPMVTSARLNLERSLVRQTWQAATSPDPRLRDPAASLVAAERLSDLAPNTDITRGNLGVAHFLNGNWAAAITCLEKCKQSLSPSSFSPGYFLAMCYWQVGRQQEALDQFAKMTSWLGEHPDEVDQRQLFNEASELIGPEVIAADLDDRVAKASKHVPSLRVRAAWRQFQGDFDGAADDYVEAFQLIRSNPWWGPHVDLCIAIAKQPEIDRLLRERLPDAPGLWIGRLRVCAMDDDWEQVEQILDILVELQPHPVNWYVMALLRHNRGYLDGYRQACDQLREIIPGSATPNPYWCVSASLLNENVGSATLDQMRTLADDAFTLAEKFPNELHWFAIGRSLVDLRAGEFEAARSRLQKIPNAEKLTNQAAADLEAPTAQFLLAMTAHALGKQAHAEETYRNALANLRWVKSQMSPHNLAIEFDALLFANQLERECAKIITEQQLADQP